MYVEHSYFEALRAGVAEPAYVILDRSSALAGNLAEQLRGLGRAAFETPTCLQRWADRCRVEEAIRRLLPGSDLETPRLKGPGHRFYMVRVTSGRLEVHAMRAFEPQGERSHFREECRGEEVATAPDTPAPGDSGLTPGAAAGCVMEPIKASQRGRAVPRPGLTGGSRRVG